MALTDPRIRNAEHVAVKAVCSARGASRSGAGCAAKMACSTRSPAIHPGGAISEIEYTVCPDTYFEVRSANSGVPMNASIASMSTP
jgi:hypothetical protein